MSLISWLWSSSNLHMSFIYYPTLLIRDMESVTMITPNKPEAHIQYMEKDQQHKTTLE